MALREDQVGAAVRFLANEKVVQSSIAEKQAFLQRKGLTQDEITEAIRRATSPSSAATAAATVAAAPPVGIPRQGGPPPQWYPQPVATSAPYAPMPPGAGPPGIAPPWQQAGGFAPWQAYTPGPMGHPPPQEPPAPWWVLLLGGLGFGSAVAMLGTLLWRRNSQRSALELQPGTQQWARWDSQGNIITPGLAQPPALLPPIAGQQLHGAAVGLDGSAVPAATHPIVSTALAPSSGEQGPGHRQQVAPDTQRLEDLAHQIREHVEETREATASLRRTLEQQQRQYAIAIADFQRKMEETQRKKSTAASQRVEISPESLQMLKSLISTARSTNDACGPSLATSSANGSTESLQQWFSQVERNLRQLLRSATSAAEAKKSLQTVSMIIHNLVTGPKEKYREVNTSSARFRETFGGSDGGAAELLQLAGFDCHDQAFIFPSDRGLDEAERVRDIMQEALRDCDRRWEQAITESEAGEGSANPADARMEPSPSSSGDSGGCGLATGHSEPMHPTTVHSQIHSNPSLLGQQGPPESSHEAQPPWLARTPWASGRPAGLSGSAGPTGTITGLGFSAVVNGGASSSCSNGNGSVGHSNGQASSSGVGGPAQAPRSPAPWMTIVVQKQLSRIPAAGGPAHGASSGSGNQEDEARSDALASQTATPVAAHPAEAREGTQEPQSGG